MQWVGETKARAARPVISAHEANAQRVQAVGSSRETHPKKRNLRNEPMKCIRAVTYFGPSGFNAGRDPLRFSNMPG